MVWRGGGFGGANSVVGTDSPLYEETDDASASCIEGSATMLLRTKRNTADKIPYHHDLLREKSGFAVCQA